MPDSITGQPHFHSCFLSSSAFWSFHISSSKVSVPTFRGFSPLNSHPYCRKQRRSKEPLDESKRGEWKVGLKPNTQKTRIMASGPITSWQIDGETMETVGDLILGGSKITVNGDCSHEIKRSLLLGRKAVVNLDSIFKRDTTLPTKVHLVKAVIFPVVTNGCENWTIKKAERWIDVFELWCWRKLLRVPWTARRSNQCILKEISPEYLLERLMMQLKFQ